MAWDPQTQDIIPPISTQGKPTSKANQTQHGSVAPLDPDKDVGNIDRPSG